MDKPHELMPSEQRLIQAATHSHRKYRPRIVIPDNTVPIVQYSQRRYYSRLHRCYVRLYEIGEWWLEGKIISIMSSKGQDITERALIRVAFELIESGRVKVAAEQLLELMRRADFHG